MLVPLLHIGLKLRSLSSSSFLSSSISSSKMGEEAAASVVPSLRIGSKSLQSTPELAVPPIPKSCLEMRLKLANGEQNSTEEDGQREVWQGGAHIPTSFGPMISTRVMRNEPISRCENGRIHKPKYLLELAMDGEEGLVQKILANFDAGDSCCILFENPPEEVQELLENFGHSASADRVHELVWKAESVSPPGFDHLPSTSSPRRLLSQFVDIRRAPARSLLRALAEFAEDGAERRRLLELASTQGSAEFTKFVRQANISLLDLARAFPSLRAPIPLLIELLPRLLPRHYTLTNFLPAQSAEKLPLLSFRFTYSLLPQAESGTGEGQRYGVCSQWLKERKIGHKIWLVQKEPSKFRLPPFHGPGEEEGKNPEELLATPLLMIGPGTGVAPFLAFLQKIRHLQEKLGGNAGEGSANANRILIYASSCLDSEFLFREELEQFERDGILSRLILCESRAEPENPDRPKRIYDALKQLGTEVADFLDGPEGEEGEPLGLVYACGDVKNMSRQLWACFAEILQKHRGMSPAGAVEQLKKLRLEERLIEDVWS